MPKDKAVPLSATTQATAALHQAMAILHPMDRAFGGDFDPGEPAGEALSDLTGTPTGVLALDVQDYCVWLGGFRLGSLV